MAQRLDDLYRMSMMLDCVLGEGIVAAISYLLSASLYRVHA